MVAIHGSPLGVVVVHGSPSGLVAIHGSPLGLGGYSWIALEKRWRFMDRPLVAIDFHNEAAVHAHGSGELSGSRRDSSNSALPVHAATRSRIMDDQRIHAGRLMRTKSAAKETRCSRSDPRHCPPLSLIEPTSSWISSDHGRPDRFTRADGVTAARRRTLRRRTSLPNVGNPQDRQQGACGRREQHPHESAHQQYHRCAVSRQECRDARHRGRA